MQILRLSSVGSKFTKFLMSFFIVVSGRMQKVISEQLATLFMETMASYSQDALDRLSKGNLKNIILQLQTKLEAGKNEVLEEVRMLNKNFAK